MQQFTPLLALIATLAIFWFLLIRPARKQQQALASIQQALSVGDRVVLSSGIFGTITELLDTRVHLEIANGVVIEAARQAVVRRADELPPANPTDITDNAPTEQ